MKLILGCIVPGSPALYRTIQEDSEPLTTLHDGICGFVHAAQQGSKLSPKSAVRLFLAVRDGKWLQSASPEVVMLMEGARLDREYWKQPMDLTKTIGDYFSEPLEPFTINIVVDWWDESLAPDEIEVPLFGVKNGDLSSYFFEFLSHDGKKTHVEFKNLETAARLIGGTPLDQLESASNMVMILREKQTNGVKRSEGYALLCRRWFHLSRGGIVRLRSLSEQIDLALPRDMRLVEFTSLDQFVRAPQKTTMYMPKHINGQMVNPALANIDAFIMDGRGMLYWLVFSMDTRRVPKKAGLASVITIFRPVAVKVVYVTPIAYGDAFPPSHLPVFEKVGSGEQYVLGVDRFSADPRYP